METRELLGKRLFVLRGTLGEQANRHLVFRQPTFELDPPYRYSNTVVFRVGRGRGVMLGWWRKSPAESLQEHFELALNMGREKDFGRDPNGFGTIIGDLHPVQRAEVVRTVAWADMTPEERAEAGPHYAFRYPGVYNVMDVIDEEPI